MSKLFKNLIEKLPQDSQDRISQRAKKELNKMALQELREAKQLSQTYLAEKLATKQANISRIERRADMYISTLRNYIHALGGELDIIARFPEGEIHINQFKDIAS